MSEQWEYKVANKPPDLSAEAEQNYLNTQGLEGWELVTVLESGRVYWKRLLTDRSSEMNSP